MCRRPCCTQASVAGEDCVYLTPHLTAVHKLPTSSAPVNWILTSTLLPNKVTCSLHSYWQLLTVNVRSNNAVFCSA